MSSIIILLGICSCHKNDNNPVDPKPSEKKKYVWGCGQPDSTGYGMILFSSDGGDTWIRQGLGLPALLNCTLLDILATDENNVWAVGHNNTVIKTTDGGKNWFQISISSAPSSPSLSSISIVDKTNVWILGDNGTVYHSADNGATWTICDSSFFNHAFLQGIWALTPAKVFVAGGRTDSDDNVIGYIAYTLNAGASWDSLVPANNFNQNEWIGVSSYENTILIYGRKSNYIVSFDGGITWINDSIPGTGGGGGGADINHLIMLGSETWWGAFDMGQVFITTDAGENWVQQQTPPLNTYFLMGIDTWDKQTAIAVGVQAQ